ncbi:hypothetical protein [Francisella tularensis]|uniref:hypothetical protein n=1 Tax=Francisella tularensis TaxID=263 RepID=UPI00174B7A2B|nr:hypothetical protein [Francisella tularensis]MBD5784300.1 hypothetical protein [Francisella tularensis subsp. holarctica]
MISHSCVDINEGKSLDDAPYTEYVPKDNKYSSKYKKLIKAFTKNKKEQLNSIKDSLATAEHVLKSINLYVFDL